MTTPRAQAVISSGRPLRILHIFDHLVNLVDDRQQVITISDTAVSIGPFSLIVEGRFPANINRHSLVIPNPKKQIIAIDKLQIKTSQATIWHPQPDWAKLRTSPPPMPELPDHLPQAIIKPYKKLQTTLLTRDTVLAQTAVEQLAGLGSGLTPAGDDLLTGVIFALWVWMPGSPLINKISQWAAPRTTTLSAAYLHAASAGEAFMHWHHIIDGDARALDQLLAIGHTSGRDSWYGFIETYNFLVNNTTTI